MTSIRHRQLAAVASVVLALVLMPTIASAHGVFGKDALFLQNLQGRAIGPLMYLGAKHMVTGYDHLLFLVGVIFFLYRPKDIVQYVSLFTIGHSADAAPGVLGVASTHIHRCGHWFFSGVRRSTTWMSHALLSAEHPNGRPGLGFFLGRPGQASDFALSTDGLVPIS